MVSLSALGLVLIVLALVAVAAVWLIRIYNRLVSLRVTVENAWADIDVQLKRRHDLVPNLVNTVKGYMGHERSTLEAVVEARNSAVSAEGPAAQGAAEGFLTGALKNLFALAEAYPQLRSVESFTSLQENLDEIEEALQMARRYYNASVRELNTRIAQFPAVMVAGPMGFTKSDFFEIESQEKAVPEIDFTPSEN